jgi:uncharacterized protein YdhG (YjbR/CyaY superfamily)
MEKLHPLVMKYGPSLEPTVKWGHAIYLREGKMMLIAAPRKKHVGFGYPTVSGLDDTPINFHSSEEVDEKVVAAFVRKIA